MDQISLNISPLWGLVAGVVVLWISRRVFGPGGGGGSGSSWDDDSDGDLGGD